MSSSSSPCKNAVFTSNCSSSRSCEATILKKVRIEYKEAVRCGDSENWISAMHEEMQSLEKNSTWEVVPLPKEKMTISYKWIFNRKEGRPKSPATGLRFAPSEAWPISWSEFGTTPTGAALYGPQNWSRVVLKVIWAAFMKYARVSARNTPPAG